MRLCVKLRSLSSFLFITSLWLTYFFRPDFVRFCCDGISIKGRWLHWFLYSSSASASSFSLLSFWNRMNCPRNPDSAGKGPPSSSSSSLNLPSSLMDYFSSAFSCLFDCLFCLRPCSTWTSLSSWRIICWYTYCCCYWLKSLSPISLLSWGSSTSKVSTISLSVSSLKSHANSSFAIDRKSARLASSHWK